MKRPSFQFYPDDWQSNRNLRRCTHEERGVWMDIMCLLHDSDEYGILRWSIEEIAVSVHTSISVVVSLYKKSVLKGVPGPDDYQYISPTPTKGETEGATTGATKHNALGSTIPVQNYLPDTLPLIHIPTHARVKGDPVVLIENQPGPLWFSSRMVLDEYHRMIRAANGSKALESENHPQNTGKYKGESSPTPTKGETEGATTGATEPPTTGASSPSTTGATPSSSSSSSSSKDLKPFVQNAAPLHDGNQRFELFWNKYPVKKNKANALKTFLKLKPDASLFEQIMAGLDRAIVSADWVRDGGRYIPHPQTWLNANGWLDETASAEYSAEQKVALETYNQILGGIAGWAPVDQVWIHSRAVAIENFLRLSDKPDWLKTYFNLIAPHAAPLNRANFDWVIRPETFAAVKERRYPQYAGLVKAGAKVSVDDNMETKFSGMGGVHNLRDLLRGSGQSPESEALA